LASGTVADHPVWKCPSMQDNFERKFPRRDLFRLAMAGTGAALIGSQLPEPAAAQSVDLKNKRRARYQADSAEVRNFYRVNSYPTR
jgi:hypothetical protein